MTTTNQTGHKTSPTDSTESTEDNNETAPFVCPYDGCFAAFGSTSARSDHEDSDYDDEDGPTEVGA